MKSWAVHVVFATILACSLAVKRQAADESIALASPESAVLHVAQSHGLSFLEDSTIYNTDYIHALVFGAPGCSQPIRVVLRSLSLSEEPLVQSAPEYVRRYVYIESNWTHPHRLAVWLQRAKYYLLTTIGQTQYIPSGQMLQVEIPRHCEVADAVDWRKVWDRDYLAAAAAETKSMTR